MRVIEADIRGGGGAQKKTVAGDEASVRENFRPAAHDNSMSWRIDADTFLYCRIADMRRVAPDRLLLLVTGVWAKWPIMIDADSGSIVWTKQIFRCEDGFVNDRCFDAAVACLGVHRDTLLLRVDGNAGSRLLALETGTGNVRWSVDQKKSGALHAIPVPEAGVLLAVRQEERRSTVTALDLSTGAAVWKTETDYARGTEEPPVPTVSENGVWLFLDGIAKLSPKTGKTLWRRPDILAGRQAPTVRLENGRLYLIDQSNTLHVLDAESGETAASAKQRDSAVYTNIFPAGDRVYLRGVEKGISGAPRFFVAAVRETDGKELWADTDKEPSVSGLIDENGSVFFATPFTVVSLDRVTGKRRFAVRATGVGRNFPARIESYGDRIVFVGELVVAAYDAKTGAPIYRHVFEPLNQTAQTDALDWAIEKSREFLSRWSGPFSGSGWNVSNAGLSNFFFQQSRASQEMATTSSKQASEYRSKALSNPVAAGADSYALKSDVARLQAKMERGFSSAQFSIGVAFSTLENIQKAIAQFTGPEQARLMRLLNTRRLLFTAYTAAQQGDYVHRATPRDGAVGMTIVHLPTGRAEYTRLTSGYEEVGLLGLVDFERRVVYHPGAERGKWGANGYFAARPANIPK